MARPKIISPAEAAEALGVSPSHLRKLKGIPGEFRTVGRQRRFLKNQAFLEYAHRKRERRRAINECEAGAAMREDITETTPFKLTPNCEMTSVGLRFDAGTSPVEYQHVLTLYAILSMRGVTEDARHLLFAYAQKSRWQSRDLRRFIEQNPWVKNWRRGESAKTPQPQPASRG